MYTTGDDAGKDVEGEADDGDPPGDEDLGSISPTIQWRLFQKARPFDNKTQT